MGIFSQTNSFEKFIKDTNENVSFVLKMEELNPYLDKWGEEMLTKFIKRIIVVENYYKATFYKYLEDLLEIYKVFVTIPDSLELENAFNNIADLYFKNNNIVNKNNILKVSNSFNDKLLVVEFFRFLLNNENILDGVDEINMSILIGYLEEARQYFVDDRALFSSIISLINEVDPAKLKYGKEKDLKRVINKKILEDKKANGIYNIDQATLREIDRKIEKFGVLSERANTLIELSEKQILELANAADEHRTVLTEARIEELKNLSTEAANIIKNFNASYLELLGQQKQSIINEKDMMIADIVNEIEKKKLEISSYSDKIGQSVALELRRIRNASSDSIQKIEEFLSDNEKVQQFLGEAKNSNEFLQQLKEIEKFIASTGGTQPPKSQIIQSGQTVSANPSTLDGLVIPAIILPGEERELDSNVNYYFDKRIPFRQRFSELMEIKQRLIEEKGSIYHEKFDDILTMILQNDVPYMYGPSGCGKTYMIQKQLADLLGVSVITNGYVLYEQDILGYTNSGTGAYVPSNFYRAYKFGDIIFFDELDNGVANATTVLNSFLTGDDTDKYVFPNGEQISRHSNFRIISAGNTKGSGKTLAHNTRQKMDESVMQRLTPIEVSYDNRIEKKILEDYPGWYDFAINFRHAIESIPSETGDDVNSIGTFTTRDAQSIKKYKDDGAMTDEQLIDYEIIENKDIDYLNQIKLKLENLDNNGEFKTKDGKKLLKTFTQKVETRRR